MFGISTTGAANDIERATDLARKMVTQYGMSEKFGLMALSTVQSQYLDGQAYLDCSQDTAARVDRETEKLLERCYQDAVRILTENRALLDEIALYLLTKETITGEELMSFIHAEKDAAPAEEEAAPTEPEQSAE